MKYDHIISLGYFCSPALELERFGLRDCSSPFDWCISELNGVESCIKNNFDNFLSYDLLYQNSKKKYIYKNIKYGISFFHDFNSYQSLSQQLDSVNDKYKRRISRFYSNISRPTLFIRYIQTQNNLDEAIYIYYNHEHIRCLLKKFNPCNDIVYIINDDTGKDICEKIPSLFFVTKDDGDFVCRRPFDSNIKLRDLIIDSYAGDREANLAHLRLKSNTRKSFSSNVERYLNKVKEVIYPKYQHLNFY